MAGLDTTSFESGARFSPDELTVYFAFAAIGGDDGDLMVAHRDGIDDGFSTPEPIDAVNSDLRELAPSVSADGRTLVFTRWDGEANSDESLWISTRASIDADFGAPARLTALDGNSPRHGALSLDGSRLWYATTSGVFAASRVGDTFGDPVPAGVDSYVFPIVTDDELTLYHGGLGAEDLLVTERATTADPWGPESNVPFNPGDIGATTYVFTWLSPDRCRLYGYASDFSNSSSNVLVANRAP